MHVRERVGMIEAFVDSWRSLETVSNKIRLQGGLERGLAGEAAKVQ